MLDYILHLYEGCNLSIVRCCLRQLINYFSEWFGIWKEIGHLFCFLHFLGNLFKETTTTGAEFRSRWERVHFRHDAYNTSDVLQAGWTLSNSWNDNEIMNLQRDSLTSRSFSNWGYFLNYYDTIILHCPFLGCFHWYGTHFERKTINCPVLNIS